MKKLLCITLLLSSFAYANEMRLIKGGTFERSLRLLTVTKTIYRQKVSCSDFLISDTEVTIQEFYEFLKSENRELPKDILKVHNKNDYKYYPIYYITFLDAVKFCNWKSLKENFEPCYTISNKIIEWNKNASGYRLPTQTEWECAATNAGKDTEILSSDINILKKYCTVMTFNESCKYNTEDLLYIGRKIKSNKPNKNGLYDMLDNVAEYCWDYFQPDYHKNEVPEINSPEASKERVVKGGICIVDESIQEEQISPVTWTYGLPENTNSRCIGFRVARNIK